MSARPGRVRRQLDARRRRETLAGGAVAGLGVVVAIVAIVAIQHPNGYSSHDVAHTAAPSTTASSPAPTSSHRPATATSTTRSTPAATATGPRPATMLPLVVVNNTGQPGLAAKGADTFRSGGWTVTLLDNLSTPTSPTCAYYDPAVAGSQAVAQGLQRQFPVIKAVRPRFSELPDGPIVVVLTSDYPG